MGERKAFADSSSGRAILRFTLSRSWGQAASSCLPSCANLPWLSLPTAPAPQRQLPKGSSRAPEPALRAPVTKVATLRLASLSRECHDSPPDRPLTSPPDRPLTRFRPPRSPKPNGRRLPFVTSMRAFRAFRATKQRKAVPRKAARIIPKRNLRNDVLAGGAAGDRTQDRRIMSPLL